MQFTTKFAFLAATIFGAGVLALPLAPRDFDFDIEAREVEPEISAREFYHMYLEVRSDPTLDARTLDVMDMEAREYLEYLEARETANGTQQSLAVSKPPASPSSADHTVESLSPKHNAVQPVAVPSSTHAAHHTATKVATATPTQHHIPKYFRASASEKKQLAEPTALAAALKDTNSPMHKAALYLSAKKAAQGELKASPELYQAALANKHDVRHKLAVSMELKDAAKFEAALKDKKNLLHPAAMKLEKRRKANTYLSKESNYKHALKNTRSQYHSFAVRKFLSDPTNMKAALHDKEAPQHKAAVKLYLSDPQHLEAALADTASPLHNYAVKIQKHGLPRHAKKPSQNQHTAGHATEAEPATSL